MNIKDAQDAVYFRKSKNGFPETVSGDDLLQAAHDVVQITGAFGSSVNIVRGARAFPVLAVQQYFKPEGFHALPNGRVVIDQSVIEAGARTKDRKLAEVKAGANDAIYDAITSASTPRDLLARLQEQTISAIRELGVHQQVIKSEIAVDREGIDHDLVRQYMGTEITPVEILAMSQTFGTEARIRAREVLLTKNTPIDVMVDY